MNPNLKAQNSSNPPQGHPLKSFSVPAPPPNSAPGTPAHQLRQHNGIYLKFNNYQCLN